MIDHVYIIVEKPGRYFIIREFDKKIYVIDFDTVLFRPVKVISLLEKPKIESNDNEEVDYVKEKY